MATSIKILTRRAAMTLILAILTASTAWAQAQATIGGITYDADGGYYVIDEPDDLRDLATYVNGTGKYRNNSTETTAHDCSGLKFKMTQDITFTYTTAWNDATSTENNFVAIGGYYDSNDRYFRGDFDGAGHTISGIRIYRSGTGYANVYQGIFGQTKGANIHGLRLADARITGYDYTGGIVGYNDGTVTDCHVANNVCIHAAQTEALYHGGIVGYNNGTVESCTSTATLTIASSATGCEDYGAIVGYNNFGTLRDNLAIGATVPAADSNTHGAIVGYNTGNGTLQRNYYSACKVASENITPSGKGCQNADVTANDGAVSAHVVILPDGVTATATTGIAYDGNFYTTSGTTITLSNTAPAPAGYQYDGYTASAGTLSGSTLTMPAADVTISVVLAAIPWAGDGSSSSPYIIEYPSQLDLLAHRVNGTHGQTLQSDGYSGKYFRLANDIAYTATTAWNDANSTEDNYEAIGYYYDGTNYRYFSGNFDGAGHTISGIRIHHSGSTNADRYQGVFGRTGSGANIHHLRLDDARITGYARTSGIVGYNYGGSTVTDCHVASDVCIHAVQSNADYHGGIVGYNEGTVANSTSAATLTIASGVTGCQYYGAIAGYNTSGTLRDNLAIGATVPATGNSYYGAIAGRNSSGTLQRNYYTACTVAGAATGKGCNNADVTANDGAVPALRDQASNAQAIALLAALASTDDDRPALPLDLGWGPGQFPLQLAARTLYKDGSWNTLCLPFAVDLTASGPLSGDNVQAMTLNTSSSNLADGTLTLNFTAATSIPAGTPFIIKWDQPSDDYEPYDGQNAATCSDLVSPVFMAVTIDAEKHDATVTNVLTFTGTYAPKDIGEDGDNTMLYLGAANKLYYPTKAMTIGTHRAYFQLLGDLTAGEPVSGSNAQQIRAFNLNFGDDEATGIISVHDSGFTVHGSDGWYTLDGRKLQGEPVQRGIYVNNGRKVVIK